MPAEDADGTSPAGGAPREVSTSDAAARLLRDRLGALCGVLRAQLGVMGVYVTVAAPAGHADVVVAASDVESRRLGDLHAALAEGPAEDAKTSSRPVFVADLASASWRGRWPVFTEVAARAGIRSMAAFPLQVGAARLGTMVVHAREPSQIVDGVGRAALAGAGRASDLLLDGLTSPGPTGRASGRALTEEDDANPSGHQVDGGDDRVPVGADAGVDNDAEGVLETPVGLLVSQGLSMHTQLYQAQGMVMADLRVSLVEALARMRAHAFAHDLDLDHVAREIVAARLRLTDDSKGGE